MDTPSIGVNITTSNDIFIEISGKRIAGVQSYSTKYNKDSKPVDVFGQDIPIGYIQGKRSTRWICPEYTLRILQLAMGLTSTRWQITSSMW